MSYYTATIKEDQDLENAVRFARLLGSRNVTGDEYSTRLGENNVNSAAMTALRSSK
jgi:hypothetical protein